MLIRHGHVFLSRTASIPPVRPPLAPRHSEVRSGCHRGLRPIPDQPMMRCAMAQASASVSNSDLSCARDRHRDVFQSPSAT
ncbi:hypothetical protein WR25_21385 [Diploscapter pachys]|uniref:Uncharacterized protein n=1 Tax=Diploscapter pachys TaxID=2018661 RepID=A0A2A2KAH0_9BILA|nr:hypothetical protein WR25_21385 [Diploscapter pachys]